MKRRSFLGLLGGAAVAGPSAAAEMAKPAGTSLSALAAPSVRGTWSMLEPIHSWGETNVSAMESAKKRLDEFLGTPPEKLDYDRRRHRIEALDPNIASMRSVSLVNKMRMTRVRDFEASREDRRINLEGIIAGLWK